MGASHGSVNGVVLMQQHTSLLWGTWYHQGCVSHFCPWQGLCRHFVTGSSIRPPNVFWPQDKNLKMISAACQSF